MSIRIYRRDVRGYVHLHAQSGTLSVDFLLDIANLSEIPQP